MDLTCYHWLLSILAKVSLVVAYHSRTKHIHRRYHWLWEKMEVEEFPLVKIHTNKNGFNMPTKSVPIDRLIVCRQRTWLRDSSPHKWRGSLVGICPSGERSRLFVWRPTVEESTLRELTRRVDWETESTRDDRGPRHDRLVGLTGWSMTRPTIWTDPIVDKCVSQLITYSSMIGSLMLPMVSTRPDIAHVVSVASRYLSNPGTPNWDAIKWIFRYTRGISIF